MGLLLLIPLGFAYLFIVVVIYNNLLANIAEEESMYAYLTLTSKDRIAVFLACSVAPLIGIVMWDVWYMFKPNRYPPRKKDWEKYKSFAFEGEYFSNGDRIVHESGEYSPGEFAFEIYKKIGVCSYQRVWGTYGRHYVVDHGIFISLSSELVYLSENIPLDLIVEHTIRQWVEQRVYPSKQHKVIRDIVSKFPDGDFVVPSYALTQLYKPYMYARFRSEGL